MTRRSDPELTVIWWDRIPAQVIARHGRRFHRAELPPRFQHAIDALAMRTGYAGTDAYLDQWHRRTRPCSAELDAEVAAEVAALDRRFHPDTLAELVRSRMPEEIVIGEEVRTP